MANMNDLKDALTETLEGTGVLNEIRTIMRAAIYNSIENDDKPKPKLPDENLIINELIREYLLYNNYHYTNSVFIPETGQPKQPPFDRNFIAKELNVLEDNNTKKLPLLYSLIFGLKQESYIPNQDQNKGFNQMPVNPLNFSNNVYESNKFSTNKSNDYYQINQSNQPKPIIYDK